MPGTITAGGDLQAENGPEPPPVTPLQVEPLYRLNLSHTNESPCGTGSQALEHILQDCPTYQDVEMLNLARSSGAPKEAVRIGRLHPQP